MVEALRILLTRLGIETDIKEIVDRSTTELKGGLLLALDLSGLDISQIPLGVFDEFPELQKLILNNNRIFDLSSHTFSLLNSLKYLDLSNNRLRELRTSMFSGLKSIEELYLSNNSIENMEDDLFDDLGTLNILDISNNKVEYLPSSLESLDNLDKFNPSNNPLKLS